MSKKTTESESRYHSSRLELLAIIWSVERLRSLLISINFKIVTDCQAIIYLNSKKSVQPQVARWFNLLQEYSYEFEFRKGERMVHVDALSRAPIEEASDTEDGIYEKRLRVLLTFPESVQITMMQRKDDKLRGIIEILEKPQARRSKEEKDKVADYELLDGRLIINREVNGERRKLFVVPNPMRKSMVVKNHDLAGHFSVDRTVSRILENYWFPRIRRYTRRHISSCMECLVNKVPGGKTAGLLNPIPPPTGPFQRIHVDNIGPFVRTSRGNEHLFVIVDAFTRFVNLYPIKSTKANAVIRCMEDFTLKFGNPQHLVSDRGTCFTSTCFKKFCQDRGIKLTFTSPRHPQANGIVERVNRTLIPVIQAEMSSERHWDLCIKRVQWDLNTSINKTTRQAPYKLLYGYIPSLGNAAAEAEVSRNCYEEVTTLQQRARGDILKAQEKYSRQYNKRRHVGQVYDIGEIVVVRAANVATGHSTKLQGKYKGPYVIVEQLPANTYRMRRMKCGEDNKQQITTTAHVSQLKGYYNDWESESEDESFSEDDVVPQVFNQSSDHDPIPDDNEVGTAEEEEQALPEDHKTSHRERNEPETRPRRIRKAPTKYDNYVM